MPAPARHYPFSGAWGSTARQQQIRAVVHVDSGTRLLDCNVHWTIRRLIMDLPLNPAKQQEAA